MCVAVERMSDWQHTYHLKQKCCFNTSKVPALIIRQKCFPLSLLLLYLQLFWILHCLLRHKGKRAKLCMVGSDVASLGFEAGCPTSVLCYVTQSSLTQFMSDCQLICPCNWSYRASNHLACNQPSNTWYVSLFGGCLALIMERLVVQKVRTHGTVGHKLQRQHFFFTLNVVGCSQLCISPVSKIRPTSFGYIIPNQVFTRV